MDTPESDVSAIQSGAMEPLPLYVEDVGTLTRTQNLIADLSIGPTIDGYLIDSAVLYSFVEAQSSPPPIEIDPKSATPASLPEPIMECPVLPYRPKPDDLTCVKQAIVTSFFTAIKNGNGEAVTLFIMNRLVSANTTSSSRTTPLLAAVSARDVQMVKLLISLGADPDAYGILVSSPRERYASRYSSPTTHRTPLQLAASIGHLPLVKLLLDTYHCDDAAVAPDGQIALRLAAANGHRDVVDFLPARRGGGFKRWQHAHAKAIARSKSAARKIARFGKFILWDLEKFFLWEVPRDVIVKPVARGCRWCWARRGLVTPWCAYQLGAMPGRISRAAAEVWRQVKKVPRALWWFFTVEVPRLVKDFAFWVWELVTVHIPKAISVTAKWLWELITVRIPNVIGIAAKWLWQGVKATGSAVWNVLLRIISFLHTLLTAIVTFFRSLTFADVYNGFVSVLHAIFVAFPKTLWSWACSFWDISYNIMVAAFGTAGAILWWVIVGIGWLATYVPRKLWVILSSMGGSVANAWWEVLVFFRPKA